MPTYQLQIEWQPQQIEVSEDLNKALVIKDPLALIAQTIGVPTTPKEERVKYGPTSVENFWFLFQDLMKEEFNRQLGTTKTRLNAIMNHSKSNCSTCNKLQYS